MARFLARADANVELSGTVVVYANCDVAGWISFLAEPDGVFLMLRRRKLCFPAGFPGDGERGVEGFAGLCGVDLEDSCDFRVAGFSHAGCVAFFFFSDEGKAQEIFVG